MRFPLIQTSLFTALIFLGVAAAVMAAPFGGQDPGQIEGIPPGEWSPGAAPGGPAGCGPAGCEPSCDGPQGGLGFLRDLCNAGDCGPRWTFTADELALQRSSPRSQSLFEDLNTSAPVFTASDLDVPLSLGLEVSAIRHNVFGSCFDVEVGYFQTDWAVNAGVAGGPNGVGLVTDANGIMFRVADSGIRYTSGLHLGEINLRHELFDGFTVLAGFRMGELDEHYGVDSTGVNGGSVTLDTQTYNRLYGFQVGTDAELFDACGPLQLHVLCKAGLYADCASQKNHQTDPHDGIDDLVGATRDQTAFMGETGLVLSYEVNCHLSFRVTANAVWLQCVALAPDQIGTTTFDAGTGGGAASVDSHGGIFYYGGGVGTEIKF